MDLVRELKDVRFELSLRGYDCEAVDAFLARLRTDITSIQGENDSAMARIAELESLVESGGGSSETEGTLRRTLLLAQRLADETEAEAKKAAAELTEAAGAEAAQMRARADSESSSMRAAGEQELSDARAEAEAIRETTSEEAARARSEARSAVEHMLAEAERRGMERVAVLEQTAQVEAAAMREPIREEVGQLESVRARLLADIAALETHLEQQRVRVRTAVEALRVGMSGSIDDLERVAEDDELLATQPSPEVSGASAADVAEAPDIQIVDRTAANAPEAPSADAIEGAGVSAQADADVDDADDADDAEVVDTSVDAPIDFELDLDLGEDLDDESSSSTPGEESAREFEGSDVDGGTSELEISDAEVVEDHGPATERIPLVEGVSETTHDLAAEHPSDVEEILVEIDDDAGWTDHATERMDDFGAVSAIADERDLAEAELIELDDEPSALFGTAVASDALASEIDDGTTGDVDATHTATNADSADEESNESDEAAPSGQRFVDRFSELLDALPIIPNR